VRDPALALSPHGDYALRPLSPPLWRHPLFVITAALLIALVAHAATVTETVSLWGSSRSYKFSWVVIPTLAYLLWHNRNHFRTIRPSASLVGVVLTLACALLWIAGDLVNIAFVRQLALVTGIVALVLAGTGRALFFALLPTLLLLFFLVPLGDLFITPLKYFLILFNQGFAALIGLPFSQDGFTFFIGSHDYTVIDACAGLAYFLSSLFLGLTFALLIYRSWWRIIALTLFAGGLGILANCLRVCAIVVYDHLSGSQMSVPEHVRFEVPAAVLCLAVLFLVYARLKGEALAGHEDVRPSEQAPLSLATNSVCSILAAALLLSVAPMVTSGMDTAVGDDVALEPLPEVLGNWQKQANRSQWMPQVTSADVFQSAASYSANDQTISVFIAQPSSYRAKISGGAINLVDADGWIPGGVESVSLCSRASCVDTLKYTLRRPTGGKDVRYVYSTYMLDGQAIVSPLRLRIHRAWNRLHGAPSRPRLIAVMHDDTLQIGASDLAAMVLDLAPQR
jgi:exosortase